MNNCHIAVFILFKIYTFHKICVHQADFISWEKPEVLLRRLLHKIISLDVQLTPERYFSAAQFFIFQIVRNIQIFNLILRIIIDHQFDGIKYSHHTRLLHLKILADAVFKHRIIHRTLCLGHSAQVDKHLDGLRCKSSSAERCNRNKTRVIPAINNTVFN